MHTEKWSNYNTSILINAIDNGSSLEQLSELVPFSIEDILIKADQLGYLYNESHQCWLLKE